MKNNVILKSVDRELFGITIRQNTKDSMLSISDLQKAYEKARFMHGWKERRIERILSTDDFKERAFHLLNERGLLKTPHSVFTEMIEKEGFVKVLKGLGVWKTTGKGENRMVVADPYIWVLVAMEMNPLLYAKVVIWLTDTLIFDRIEAGDEFKPMNSAIKSIIESPKYSEYAILINKSVFGQHQRGIRNLASAKELREIAYKEKFVTDCIESGMIQNEEMLTKVLSK
jgi:hypothetical protein